MSSAVSEAVHRAPELVVRLPCGSGLHRRSRVRFARTRVCVAEMVWTKEQVDEIAEELMATDIQYDLAKIQDYSEDKCVSHHRRRLLHLASAHAQTHTASARLSLTLHPPL